jgi:hypothetical protein
LVIYSIYGDKDTNFLRSDKELSSFFVYRHKKWLPSLSIGEPTYERRLLRLWDRILHEGRIAVEVTLWDEEEEILAGLEERFG